MSCDGSPECPHCKKKIDPSLIRTWIDLLFKLPTPAKLLPCSVCGRMLNATERNHPCPGCGYNNWRLNIKKEGKNARTDKTT